MKINNLEYFRDYGFNIFSSIKVSELSEDILKEFKNQNIPFSNWQRLVLVASGGKFLWPHLAHPLEKNSDPIDNYTRKIIADFDSNCQIVYPNNQWTVPLQKISRQLNLSRQSLLGIDHHNDFGLWFAIRGVFLTNLEIQSVQIAPFESPCLTCLPKTCEKHTDFHEQRLACPINKNHQYLDEQISYHRNQGKPFEKL